MTQQINIPVLLVPSQLIQIVNYAKKNINQKNRRGGGEGSGETIIMNPLPRVSCRLHRGRRGKRRCLSKTEGFVLKRLIPKWVITYKTRGP